MNTGSGLCVYSVTQSCATLWDPMDYNLPTSLFCSGNYPGKKTGVDCHFLFQGISPTQQRGYRDSPPLPLPGTLPFPDPPEHPLDAPITAVP